MTKGDKKKKKPIMNNATTTGGDKMYNFRDSEVRDQKSFMHLGVPEMNKELSRCSNISN